MYKLLCPSNTRSFKTTSSNFFAILFKDFNNIINKYLIRELRINVKEVEFVFLRNSLFYTMSKTLFMEYNVTTDPKIILIIPLIFKDNKNKFHWIYYNIGEIPRITLDKNFNINGIEKIFINKTVLNKRGVYYNMYIKANNTLIYCRYIINESNVLYVVLEKGICFIIFNNIKVDFISFLLYMGISISFLFKYLNDDAYVKFSQHLTNFNRNTMSNIQRKELLKIVKFIHLNFSLKRKLWFSISSSEYLTLFNLEIINIYNSLINIENNKNNFEEIDSLSTKQILGINNYLIYFFKIHLKKKVIEIRKDIKSILCGNLIKECCLNIKTTNYFNAKEYLTVNPHIQCLDKTNNLAKLSQKNKISYYNSLSRSITVRNVKLSNLGFISPIDTTEGINCGLTLGLTKNVRFSTNNKLEIPLLSNKINKYNMQYLYMSPEEVEKNSIIFANHTYRKSNLFYQEVATLTKNSLKIEKYNNASFFLNYKDILSYSENLIPFLLYNDPARVLMGARMQNQALPLYKKTNYFITTGEEQNIICNISNILRSKQEGVVVYVSNNKIIIRDIYNRKHIYYLAKFKENNLSIINQTPIVWPGERVFCGQLLVSVEDSMDSSFIVGNNVNVAYGNFFGYNFEDSIIINKRIVYSHLFTSFKSDVYEITFKRPTQCNEIEILDYKPKQNNLYSIRNIDEYGIVKEGTRIEEGDILVSKFIISNLSNSNSNYSFILKLLGNSIRLIKNRSLFVVQGGEGRVVKTEVFSSINYRFYLKVRLYIIQHRIIKIGDKLCGFYGNKGVISYVISNKDVVYTGNGNYPDLITDAIGVPSRMNLGQLFENLFGLNCAFHGIRLSFINYQLFLKGMIKTVIYNLAKNSSHLFGIKKFYNYYSPGKLLVRNGLSGYNLKEPTFLGVARYFKLLHMVDDKIHYRTIGPYTEVIQQPSKGKNNNGGQRFGEMEIWALQAYGNSYTIRELLAYKSDDIVARNSILSYYNNQNLSKITMSEALNNFINEINSLSLILDKFITSKQIYINKIHTNKLNLI